MTEEFLLDKAEQESFRLNSNSVFLTYKTHLEFNNLFKWINRKQKIDKYIICHETGDNTNDYEHTHAAVKFIKKMDTKDCRYFDYKKIHPNIGSCRKWNAAVQYCLKGSDGNDPIYKSNIDIEQFLKQCKKNGGLKAAEFKELCDKAKVAGSCAGYIRENCESLKDVNPLKILYEVSNDSIIDKELMNKVLKMELWNWQNQIVKLISVEPDDRTINWIIDTKGGNGKSKLVQFLRYKHLDECFVIANTGKVQDISDNLRNWMMHGRKPKIVLVDIPRTYENNDSIYTVLESFKNGLVTCNKYKGTNLEFSSPHIIVFSNFSPKTELLSGDRWNILKIKDEKIDATLITADRTNYDVSNISSQFKKKTNNHINNKYDSLMPENGGMIKVTPIKKINYKDDSNFDSMKVLFGV